MVAAVRAAASGTAWLSPRAARALLDRMRLNHRQAGLATAADDDLSHREIEVLQLLARGLDDEQIAAELSISPRMAKNHVSAILSKLVERLVSRTHRRSNRTLEP